MAGYDSIMGLSLSLVTGEAGAQETRACCVIGLDAPPEGLSSTAKAES